jgi:hypothetical protein
LSGSRFIGPSPSVGMHIPPAGGPRQWAVSCACASVPKRADCHPPLSSTPRGQARNPVTSAPSQVVCC